MNQFLDLNNQLIFHCFDVCIKAAKDTEFEAWPGAILRNNLLYAMNRVYLQEQPDTLFELCQKNPLPLEHPLYNELEDGSPRPYYLYVHPFENLYDETLRINKSEEIHFTLTLIGSVVRHLSLFVDALNYMCRKGIGVHSKPFELIDVREVSAFDENRLLYRGNREITGKLKYPFRLFPDVENSRQRNAIRIIFESPVCLIKSKKRKNTIGFQEKSNAFPGFYQLVRSAAYRLEKLHALYAAPQDIENYIKSHACIDDYIEKAAYAQLEQVYIQKVYLQNSKKKGTDKRIPLVGFIGEQVYQGDFAQYISLLKYMENLGVGHELTYGFGKYKIEI